MKSCVSEICVKRIPINQRVGVFSKVECNYTGPSALFGSGKKPNLALAEFVIKLTNANYYSVLVKNLLALVEFALAEDGCNFMHLKTTASFSKI